VGAPVLPPATRSGTIAAQVGKKVASAYHGSDPRHSYYDSYSAGGNACCVLDGPRGFDGVIAGPQASTEQPPRRLRHMGLSCGFQDCSYIPVNIWNTTVTPDILKQCDGNHCRPRRLPLRFDDPPVHGRRRRKSFETQVDEPEEFYKPSLGPSGSVTLPWFGPGAEGDMRHGFWMLGTLPPLRGIKHDPRLGTGASFRAPPSGTSSRRRRTALGKFFVTDLRYTNIMDPVGISAWANSFQTHRVSARRSRFHSEKSTTSYRIRNSSPRCGE